MKIRNKTGGYILAVSGGSCQTAAPGEYCCCDGGVSLTLVKSRDASGPEPVRESRSLRGGLGLRYGKTYVYTLVSHYAASDGVFDAVADEYDDTSVILPEHKCVFVRLSGAPSPRLSFRDAAERKKYVRALIPHTATVALLFLLSCAATVLSAVMRAHGGGVLPVVFSSVFLLSFSLLLAYDIVKYTRLCRSADDTGEKHGNTGNR